MSTSLRVSTPEGSSGAVLTSAGDYLFRYDAEAARSAEISLLMPVLALSLAGNKSLFASRLGLLDFAEICGVDTPAEIIRRQLDALERVLANAPELCEQAPHVVAAIKQSAGPFLQSFG